MVMFLQKVDNIRNKSVISYQNFAAEVTKLGAGDEIRRFDGNFSFKNCVKFFFQCGSLALSQKINS